MKLNQIIQGDTLKVLKKMPSDLVDTIITSPPYWGLRDYGVKGQIGLEPTLDEFIEKNLAITKELQRVLKPTGVMYWNHGDNYGSSISGGLAKNKGDGLYERKMNRMRNQKETDPRRNIDFSKIKEKCLCLQNYRLIIEMINQGWILRNTIIWHKPNHMPSSVKDRFSNSYEPVFMLVKRKKYWFDLDAVRVKVNYPEDVERRIRQDRLEGINPFAKDNKEGIEWRRDVKNPNKFNIRERVKRGGKPVAFMASPQETTKILKEDAESFGSSRARNYRKPIDKPDMVKPDIFHLHDNYNPKGKNPGDVWKIATQPFPEAHFATFPEKLITPMILSSCPKEICKKCGKARVRIVKLGNYSKEPKRGTQPSSKRAIGSPQQSTAGGMPIREKETIGWIDCKCNAGFRPGIVLDPFIGSGTVAVVARRFKRNWLGIELNEKYIKIAKKRITAQPVPML